jgi:hypothetical protein
MDGRFRRTLAGVSGSEGPVVGMDDAARRRIEEPPDGKFIFKEFFKIGGDFHQ